MFTSQTIVRSVYHDKKASLSINFFQSDLLWYFSYSHSTHTIRSFGVRVLIIIQILLLLLVILAVSLRMCFFLLSIDFVWLESERVFRLFCYVFVCLFIFSLTHIKVREILFRTQPKTSIHIDLLDLLQYVKWKRTQSHIYASEKKWSCRKISEFFCRKKNSIWTKQNDKNS